MDPSIVLVSIAPQPTGISSAAAVFDGALTPLVIPTAWLPADVRARWFLRHASLPLSDRIAAALAANFTDEAWKLLLRTVTSPMSDPRLELTLLTWQRKELQRLGIPESNSYVLVAGGVEKERKHLQTQAAGGLSDVHEMLEHIGWPRWSGAVLIVQGDGVFDALPQGQETMLRPVLPIVRCTGPKAGETPREQFAARFCGLALDMCVPPDGGWPAWLALGLPEVAKAKARGEGPSPSQMLAIRQAAGKNGVADCLSAKNPPAQLAMAICAPLAHSRRRHLLPNLLDLLRHGADSASALKIAYDLTADELSINR